MLMYLSLSSGKMMGGCRVAQVLIRELETWVLAPVRWLGPASLQLPSTYHNIMGYASQKALSCMPFEAVPLCSACTSHWVKWKERNAVGKPQTTRDMLKIKACSFPGQCPFH